MGADSVVDCGYHDLSYRLSEVANFPRPDMRGVWASTYADWALQINW
jgi:hypothetical protein